MSVFDTIKNTLSSRGYVVQEGTIQEYITQTPKETDSVIAIAENSGTITYGLANGGSECDYKLRLQTWHSAPSQDEAWTRARKVRDKIVEILNQNTFDGIELFVTDWERNNDDLGQLHSGYIINVTYTQVSE